MQRLVLILFTTILLTSVPAEAAPRTVRDCRHCPELVAIPAGSFMMGSAADDALADGLEKPKRKVRVRAFWAGRFDVTRAEWAHFAAVTRRPTAKGCQWTGKSGMDSNNDAAWNDLGFPQTERDPVVCVSWTDARDYVRWLSRTTGKRYRMLSEAEWEYAARAGTRTAWSWGAASSHDRANHGTEECCKGLAEGRDRWTFTSPGDAFPPNAFGLHDMGGNVLQYVADCFWPSHEGLPSDGRAFVTDRPIVASGDLKDLSGTPTCNFRVVRGGSWGDQRRWIRPAARSFAPPPGPGPDLAQYRSGGVGFRVARD
jgi:formylglycine-generating enzyme required for sulfatase activity